MRRIAHREPKALLVACALFVSAVAYAQDASSISGTVVDSATKKPVADVVVTATSPVLAAEQMAVTDKEGAYSIPNLPVGDYALRFESSKHRPFSRSGISVRAGTAVKYNAELLPEEGLSEELVL
ncbi:MAG: carboxypeptidase-like regulatory domain-containing protein, partial [Myxococcaceae bacterium]|nr:carboxypeptidase-like regulatory domain-containing protein [Myxococcaceae bacterium]